MSRSRKFPMLKLENNSYYKRCANKKVRHVRLPMNKGSYYKKFFSSYDICDYSEYPTIKKSLIISLEEYIEQIKLARRK